MKHVCIDLETLSLRGNAVIVAIGAVGWDEGAEPGTFNYHFERKLSLDQPGRDIDPGTLAWWMSQSEAARSQSFGGNVSLARAMRELTVWLEGTVAVGVDLRTVCVWTNDPSFDAAILKSANGPGGVAGTNPPWYFRNTRCCRTAADLVSEEEYQELKARLDITPHSAFDDARMSGAVVQTYLQKTAALRSSL